MTEDIIPVKLTEKQKKNLRKLATFLCKKVDASRFDMETYWSPSDEFHLSDLSYTLPYDVCDLKDRTNKRVKELYNECGTVACACGHGPVAGVKMEEREGWSQYSARAFGAGEETELWDWMFSYFWADSDGTPEGAAARIDFVLSHDGIPNNYRDQMYGEAPLSYIATKKEE